MFNPKGMTDRELQDAVNPALERARNNPILSGIDLTELKHIPGIDREDQCPYSGKPQYQQVVDYREPTCPVCLKIIADTLRCELGERLGGG